MKNRNLMAAVMGAVALATHRPAGLDGPATAPPRVKPRESKKEVRNRQFAELRHAQAALERARTPGGRKKAERRILAIQRNLRTIPEG